MITDSDRTALADTYGRTLHDPAAFFLIKSSAEAGNLAELAEVERWCLVVDQLFGLHESEPVVTPAVEPAAEAVEQVPADVLALMQVIAQNRDGPSERSAWSVEYQREMRGCAEGVFAAGYSLHPKALVS